MGEILWTRTRLYAWLQRPNAQLRIELRRSLANMKVLGEASIGTSITGESVSAHASTSHSHPTRPSPPTRSLSKRDRGEVCLAMHIRHNDVTTDDRAWSGIDRSLDAHVRYSRNLTTSLGIRRIFLATDNLTVVEVAAKLYPEYIW